MFYRLLQFSGYTESLGYIGKELLKTLSLLRSRVAWENILHYTHTHTRTLFNYLRHANIVSALDFQ